MSEKEKSLTTERLRFLLHYEPSTGVFTWQNCPWPRRHNGRQAGIARGSRGNYIRIAIDGTRYYAHRLAWLYMTGKWPDRQVDHADGDAQNNRWTNLRLATPSQNAANRRGSTHRPLPKGVCETPHGYLAAITVEYRTINLGHFKTPAQAHAAYVSAAKKYFGEYARSA